MSQQDFLEKVDISYRIHKETEREIIRMQMKILRFQRKLGHLREVHAFTTPKDKLEQIDIFGT